MTEPIKRNPEYGLFYGDELWNCENDEKVLIEKMLYYGDIMCIAAEPKVGKSVFTLQLCASLTSGTPFLDTFKIDKPCKVLYIQSEGKRADTKTRWRNITKHVKAIDSNLYHMNLRGFGLHIEEGKNGIMALLKAAEEPGIRYDVIILDPLYSLIHGGSLLREDHAIAWTGNVSRFISYFGATGIVIHHDSEKEFRDSKGNIHKSKQSALFGSTIWSAFFTHSFKLIKKRGMHILQEGVQRSGEMIDEITMQMVIPQTDPKGRLFYKIHDDGIPEAELRLYTTLKKHGPLQYQDICKHANMSVSHFYRIAAKMEDEQKIIKDKDEHGKVFYKLPNGALPPGFDQIEDTRKGDKNV